MMSRGEKNVLVLSFLLVHTTLGMLVFLLVGGFI